MTTPLPAQVALLLYSQFGPLVPSAQLGPEGVAVGLITGGKVIGETDGSEVLGATVGPIGAAVVGDVVVGGTVGAMGAAVVGDTVMEISHLSPRCSSSQSQSPFASTAPPELQSTASLLAWRKEGHHQGGEGEGCVGGKRERDRKGHGCGMHAGGVNGDLSIGPGRAWRSVQAAYQWSVVLTCNNMGDGRPCVSRRGGGGGRGWDGRCRGFNVQSNRGRRRL